MKPKKLLALVLSLAMIISTLPTFSLTAAAETTTTEKNITLGTTALKGGQASNVYFGRYQQSSTRNTQPEGTNGVDWINSTTATKNSQGPYYKKDPIKWRVLSNADGKAFLLSDKNLDVVRYHEDYVAVTWEKSTIRSWLNGYDAASNQNSVDYSNDNFINAAFGAAEKGVIAETTVVNDDNPEYGTEGGNNTTDKVFLLSIAEAQNTSYFANDNSRKAVNTAYVYGGGKTGTSGMYGVGEADYWWLRSPGDWTRFAASVDDNGGVDYAGAGVSGVDRAVRPAFNLNLSSVLFTSAAKGGKTVSDGTVSKNADLSTLTDNDSYKLTLLDSNRHFAVSDTAAKTVKTGDTLTLSLEYTGATTGANEYISAMIVDANGAVIYYGQLAQADSASGTATLVVPSDIICGEYTLKIFNEQINGDYKTDYSSNFVDISLTVGHNYNNGICTVCGAIAPIEKNANGVYEIYVPEQLVEFAQIVNGTHATIQQDKAANAILMADIDMDGIDWTTICSTGLYYSNSYASGYGTADTGYAGTFDGDGYVIKNLSVTAIANETWTYGLFGTMTGTVKNLGIEGFTYNHNGATDMRVGAIVGQLLGGTIENCYVRNATINPGTNVAGGITGCNYAGTIKNCYVADSTVLASSSRYGYIAGDNRADTAGDRVGTIENCYTDGDRLVGSYTGTETGCGIREESRFASGEITYQLNGGSSDGIWKLNASGLPAFTGDTVYQNLCGGDVFYSTTDGDFDSHDIGSDYRCINCKSYEPATLVTAENYSSLGLDESYVGYYAIENASNLYWYSERERIGDISGSIVLLNNITLDNLKAEWVPIVWDGDCTFDGRGNTITLNLDYGTTQHSENYGLFGTCNYSVVKNLVLDGDLAVNTTGHVGAVAGSMYRTTVSGVISTVNVTNNCTTSGSVGGLAGCFGGQHDTAKNQYSKIENSAVYANVTGYNAGGLVGEGWGGYQYWDITNAAYVGNVTTNNTTSGTAGAIVGYQNTDYNTSTFTNIYWNKENGLDFYGKRDTENQVYTNTEAKNEPQFASGEVTYLLNSGVTDGTQAWYQTLGEDDYPKFSGKTVYYDETETVYYNEKVKVTVDGESVETDGYIVLGTDNGDGTYSLPDNVVGYYMDDSFVDAGKYAVVGSEVINTVNFNVTMVNGAQVRYGGGLDENGKVNAGNGLRFLATVDRSEFDGIGYGMKLTAEGSSAETLVDAAKWQNDTTFSVAITDMAVSNYNRNFTATPFVKVKYDDGTEKTVYGTETVTRSIYYVAAGLLKTGNNGTGLEDDYGAGESYGLYDVLNAYINMVGVRLNLYSDGTVTASDKYTGDVFFDVTSVDNGDGSYTITVTPITQDFAYPVEIMSYWNEFVRINNNNSVVVKNIGDSSVENGVLTFKFTLPSGN